ncbi:hypothetical protein tpqmel_0596 [Candidatus Gastranaerophilus sp. (ex Termes propinquus)]|nr:hypothetical protein tpqmel_0596 [Candidatus Gastranaerophilus sp. (ex Termes propinquus)]
MSSAHLSLGGLTLLKFSEPTLEIINNRLLMQLKATVPTFSGSKTHDFRMNAGIKVENEKIVFSDIKVASLPNLNANTILPLINMLNPFVFETKIDDNNTALIKIKDVKIENNTIAAKGLVILEQNVNR